MIALFVLIGCGVLIAVQATINATLGRTLGLPVFGVIFSGVQLLCALPTLALIGKIPGDRVGSTPNLLQVPSWQYFGAVLGVVILCGIAFGIARMGSFSGLIALLFGQLGMGVVIDHFGLLGASVQPLTLTRFSGLLFVVLGVWLTK